MLKYFFRLFASDLAKVVTFLRALEQHLLTLIAKEESRAAALRDEARAVVTDAALEAAKLRDAAEEKAKALIRKATSRSAQLNQTATDADKNAADAKAIAGTVTDTTAAPAPDVDSIPVTAAAPVASTPTATL